ncbi:unknown [Choristoneura occidentalis cypovirus 16]|uniref:VP2 n=1 Tax=Choristoneura fumiferana cypovirus TaxID=59730 RepID=B1PR24_CPVCS|nr:unknown [Choristoneura occidentalis cypovirus 16]ACA53381.1 unknown [Choristoneura occidentalis cypovirus 16]
MTSDSTVRIQNLILALSGSSSATSGDYENIVSWFRNHQQISNALPNIFQNKRHSERAQSLLHQHINETQLLPIVYEQSITDYDLLCSHTPDGDRIEAKYICMKIRLSLSDLLNTIDRDDSLTHILTFRISDNDVEGYDHNITITNRSINQNDANISATFSLIWIEDRNTICNTTFTLNLLDIITITLIDYALPRIGTTTNAPSDNNLPLINFSGHMTYQLDRYVDILRMNPSDDVYRAPHKQSIMAITDTVIIPNPNTLLTNFYLNARHISTESTFTDSPFMIALHLPSSLIDTFRLHEIPNQSIAGELYDKLTYEDKFLMLKLQMDFYESEFIRQLDELEEFASSESMHLEAMVINNTSTLATLMNSVAQYEEEEFKIEPLRGICQSQLSPVTLFNISNATFVIPQATGSAATSYLSDQGARVNSGFNQAFTMNATYTPLGSNQVTTYHDIFMSNEILITAQITSERVLHPTNLPGNVSAMGDLTKGYLLPRLIHEIVPANNWQSRIIQTPVGTSQNILNMETGGALVPNVREFWYTQRLDRIIISSRLGTSMPIDVDMQFNGSFNALSKSTNISVSSGDIQVGRYDSIQHGPLYAVFLPLNIVATLDSKDEPSLETFFDTRVASEGASVPEQWQGIVPIGESKTFDRLAQAGIGILSATLTGNSALTFHLNISHPSLDRMGCLSCENFQRFTSYNGVNIVEDQGNAPFYRRNMIALLRSMIIIDTLEFKWRVAKPPGNLGIRTMASEFLTNLEYISLSIQSDLEELTEQFLDLEFRVSDLERQFELLLQSFETTIWDNILSAITDLIMGFLPIGAGMIAGALFKQVRKSSGYALRVLKNSIGGARNSKSIMATMKGTSIGQDSLASSMSIIDTVLRSQGNSRRRIVESRPDATYLDRPLLQNIDGSNKLDALNHYFTNGSRVPTIVSGAPDLRLIPELNNHSFNSRPLPVLETYYRPLATLPKPLGNMAHSVTNVNKLRLAYAKNHVDVSCRKPSHAFTVMNDYQVHSPNRYSHQLTYVGIGELNPSGKPTGDLGAGIGGVTLTYDITSMTNVNGKRVYRKTLQPHTASGYSDEQVRNLYKTLYGKDAPDRTPESLWISIQEGVSTKIHTSDLVDKFVVPNKYAGQSIREMAYNPPDFKYNLLNRNCQTFATDIRNYLASGVLSNQWDTRVHDRLMRGKTISIQNDIGSSETR